MFHPLQMATHKPLLSLFHLSNSIDPPQNLTISAPSLQMRNPNELCLEDDDSWEVRAFAEDTRNIMATTWPPRSYTCTFCRREFRSAQALGGHMNVHRQDRARLHRAPSPRSVETSSSSTSKVVIPSPGFVSNGHGLCFLYQLSNPNSGFTSTPSTLLSMSPSQPDNPTFSFPPSTNFPRKIPQICTTNLGLIKAYEPLVGKFSGGKEELDLELRLGQRPTPS